MKVLFACGGTAGHINPALAVATELRRRVPDCEILFVGNPGGMEATLVPRAGFRFAPYRSMGIQRRFSWNNIKYNAKSVCLLVTARSRAKRILRDFAPDVVMGTGSYISAPILLAAAALHIPCMTHEANALPGVSNRMVAQKVDKFLLAVPEAEKHLPPRPDYIVTGNPVRPEILSADRETARTRLGVRPGQLCLLSFGGSLGAQTVNEAIADVMAWHVPEGKLHHIHATGSFGKEWMPKRVMDNGVDWKNCPALDIREYIYDMPTVMAAADIVIGRAGSATCNEIGASGTPCILIPSPNVTNNHQEKNARVLEAAGGAVVVLEKDCTPGKLYELIRSLLADEDRRREMSRKLHTMVRLDSAERICDIVEQLTQSEK